MMNWKSGGRLLSENDLEFSKMKICKFSGSEGREISVVKIENQGCTIKLIRGLAAENMNRIGTSFVKVEIS